MAYNEDPDQMPHSVASDLGLHSLKRPICPSTLGYSGIVKFKDDPTIFTFEQ